MQLTQTSLSLQPCIVDERRNYLRPRRMMGESLSHPEQQQAFLERLAALQVLMQAIS